MDSEFPSTVQIVGWTDPGIMKSMNRIFTVNQKYFAYCCFTSVVVRDINTLNIVEEISVDINVPSTISFSRDDPDLLAVAFAKGKNYIFSISKSSVLHQFYTSETIVSIGWLKNSETLMLFSQYFYRVFSYDIKTKTTSTSYSLSNNMRVLSVTDVGEETGIIGGNALGKVQFFKNFDSVDSFELPGAIIAVEFDPNNKENCIVVSETGNWCLLQVTKDKMIKVNQCKTNFNVSSASWISFMPGHFITGDKNSGVIRVWNAGNDSQIESLTISQYGIIETCSLTNGNIFCSFTDGTIMIYNMIKKKCVYKAQAPHSHMITNISFMPTDENIMCTTSTNGTYCFWNVQDMNLIERFEAQTKKESIICTDISPGAGILVSGATNCVLYVISMKTKNVIYETRVSDSQGFISSVSINKTNPKQVLWINNAGNCGIIDIELKQEIWKGPTAIVAGEFSPYRENFFVLCSLLGTVTSYQDLKSLNTKMIINEKAKCIAFSPHDNDMICLTTMNGNIAVTKMSQDDVEKTIVFRGVHNGTAFCALFHPVIEGYIISGGSDKTISVLDIKNKVMISKFSMHNSVITALGIPPKMPLMLVSTSTDSSLRFLSLDRIFNSKQAISLFNANFKDDDSFMQWLAPLQGLRQLFNLAHRIVKDKKLAFKHGDIQHFNDIRRLTEKYIQKTQAQQNGAASLIKRAITAKEKNLEAAKLHLQMGNIKKYCEFMFMAGEYEKACAAAPAVSVEFWKNMMNEMIKITENQKKNFIYSLAIGDVDSALQSEELSTEDKILINAARDLFTFHAVNAEDDDKEDQPELQYADTEFQNNELYLPYHIASTRAKDYLAKGNILNAASCFLSIGDIVTSIKLLVKHGQLLIAYPLAKVLNYESKDLEEKYMQALSRRFIGSKFYPETYKEYAESIAQYGFDISKIPLVPVDKYDQVVSDFISLATEELSSPCVDFTKLEDAIKPILNVPLQYCSEKDKILYISLYLSFFNAVWRGYYDILEQLNIKMSYEKSKLADEPWITNSFNTCQELIKMTTGKQGTTIESVCRTNHNSTNVNSFWKVQPLGQSYFIDDAVKSYEWSLMWADVCLFQVLNESNYFMFR